MPDRVRALRVLVVDDDAFAASVSRRLVRGAGVGVVDTASDGATALGAVAETRYDLLLCDLQMPGMDGVELLRHLAALADPPALVVVSGVDRSIRQGVVQLAEAHGLRVLGALGKPPDGGELRALLYEAVASAEAKPAPPPTPAVETLTPDEVREGLASDAVVPVFQPKVDAVSGALVGAEALARWRHPTRGLLPPSAFVGVAEEHGLVAQLTATMLRVALAQVGEWSQEGLPPGAPDLEVSVNVSVSDLEDLAFVDQVVEATQAAGLPPERVTLELTESKILGPLTRPLEVLARLRMRGFGLAIDDYGTGTSTMQQLRRAPFTELKVDRAFVHRAPEDPELRAMLTSAVSLASGLGLPAVAEGVETPAEWDLTVELGCQRVQGFVVARPMLADKFLVWAGAWRGRPADAAGKLVTWMSAHRRSPGA